MTAVKRQKEITAVKNQKDVAFMQNVKKNKSTAGTVPERIFILPLKVNSFNQYLFFNFC